MSSRVSNNPAALAVVMHDADQAPGPRRLVELQHPRRSHRRRCREADEGRQAHQVGRPLASGLAPGRARSGRRHAVAPDDLLVRIQQQHTVGRSPRWPDRNCQLLTLADDLAVAVTQALHAVANLTQRPASRGADCARSPWPVDDRPRSRPQPRQSRPPPARPRPPQARPGMPARPSKAQPAKGSQRTGQDGPAGVQRRELKRPAKSIHQHQADSAAAVLGQPVAGAAYRLDHDGRGIGLQRLAQALDVHVDVRSSMKTWSPQTGPAAGRGCAHRSGWVIRKCSRRNSVGPTFTSCPGRATRGGCRVRVSGPTVTRCPVPRAPWPAATARMRASNSLVEGLGDVVVGPGVEARHLVALLGRAVSIRMTGSSLVRAAERHWRASATPDWPGSIQSSRTRRAARHRRRPAPAPRRPQASLETCMPQVQRNQFGDGRLVFNNQNLAHLHHHFDGRGVVAHVRALDHVDDHLGQVLRVVTHALDGLGHEHEVDGRRDVRGSSIM